MFTQCPGCHTLFRISRRELAQADGRVRCGLCQEAFDASVLLRDRLPPELDQILGLEMGERVRRTVISQATEGSPEPPLPPPRLARGDPPESSPGEAPAAGTSPAIEPEPPAAALPEVLPREQAPPPAPQDRGADFREQAVLDAEGRLSAHQAQGLPWRRLAAALLLVLLLGGQWLYFQREILAREPGWRPLVTGFCALADCRLPLVRRPEQVALLSRTLQTHPERPGAMLLTATVVNRGPPQPWPQLGVTLRRMNGEVAARRWFAAEDYLDLSAAARAAAQPMPAGEPYPVRLAFLDPGQGANNFELDFR